MENCDTNPISVKVGDTEYRCYSIENYSINHNSVSPFRFEITLVYYQDKSLHHHTIQTNEKIERNGHLINRGQ